MALMDPAFAPPALEEASLMQLTAKCTAPPVRIASAVIPRTLLIAGAYHGR
jgi:hypothetical protein